MGLEYLNQIVDLGAKIVFGLLASLTWICVLYAIWYESRKEDKGD